jgi:hypothetical protein
VCHGGGIVADFGDTAKRRKDNLVLVYSLTSIDIGFN